MKRSQLIYALTKGPWLIDKGYAESMLPHVVAFVSGKDARAFEGVYAYHDDSDGRSEDTSSYPLLIDVTTGLTIVMTRDGSRPFASGASLSKNAKYVAVVPIQGPITKDDYCGDPGSMTRAKQIDNLSANASVAAIILDIDSPGGMVDGTQTLANSVKMAKLSKPVISMINEGMAASAAYWVGCCANEIYCTQKTDSAGSIGVFVSLMDPSGFYEQKGIKIHDIYADGSEEKNLAYKEALEGKYELIKKQSLNPIREEFVSVVTSNRAVKLNSKIDVTKGAMFMGSEAIKAGLVDGIKSFEECIARAVELAGSEAYKTNALNNTDKMKLNAKHAALIAALKFSVETDATETKEEITAESLDALDAVITGLQSDAQKAKDDLTAANEEIARLKVFEPAGTVVQQNKDKEAKDIHGGVDMKAINELPHNKALENNPLFN